MDSRKDFEKQKLEEMITVFLFSIFSPFLTTFFHANKINVFFSKTSSYLFTSEFCVGKILLSNWVFKVKFESVLIVEFQINFCK